MEISSKYFYPQYPDSQQWLINVRMELVGKGVDPMEGENGYASASWISRYPHNLYQLSSSTDTTLTWYNMRVYRTSWDYLTSDIRLYLQTEMPNYFPPELKPYLRNVIKYTRLRQPISNEIFKNYETIECINIPSYGEILRGYDDAGWTNGSFLGSTLGALYDGFFTKIVEDDGTCLVNSTNNVAARNTKLNGNLYLARDFFGVTGGIGSDGSVYNMYGYGLTGNSWNTGMQGIAFCT